MRDYWISFHCAIKSKTYCKGNELLLLLSLSLAWKYKYGWFNENDKKYDENIRIKKIDTEVYIKICNSGILLLQIMLKRYIFFFIIKRNNNYFPRNKIIYIFRGIKIKYGNKIQI